MQACAECGCVDGVRWSHTVACLLCTWCYGELAVEGYEQECRREALRSYDDAIPEGRAVTRGEWAKARAEGFK